MTPLMALSTATPLATLAAITDDGNTPAVIVDDNTDATEAEVDVMEGTQVAAFTNREVFLYAAAQELDVKTILGDEAYSEALAQDSYKAGSNWFKRYTYKGHKRLSIGVNSLIVDLLKAGGSAAMTALQAVATARGMPMDPSIYYAVKAKIGGVNGSKGHWWHINLSPLKIVASGNQ